MAFSRQFSADELSRSLHSAADKLGIDDFHPQQRSALEAFLRGHDVFVNLPTGFGKSMIFQAAPFCWDFLRQATGSIAIVISPLTALMKDQIDSLKRRGITAACLTRDTELVTKSAINKGQFSLVFASPEAMSASGRALLSADVYKKNLCGIFVDESHCVKKW
jgi:ATP-dependent DNA helicase RecQ